MRVWQYTSLDTTGLGGVETHIQSVSQALRDLGHEVHIGAEPPPPSTAPLVVHSHGDLWPNPLTLAKLRRRAPVRYIPVLHGTTVSRIFAARELLSFSGWKGSLRDFVPTLLADAVVAVSDEALASARRYFRLSVPGQVIPNGADPTIFAPLIELSQAPRLAFVGRSSDRVKNVDSLLRACTSLHRQHRELELWAAPGIENAASFHAFIRDLGPLRGKALAHELAKCRALVLCSYYEGDPIVLHEAKSLGLPVIASDLPQLRAALLGYPNSFFVDPWQVSSIEAGIERALFSVKNLRPTPRARDWSQVGHEFDAFYSELFKAKR